MPHPSYHRLKIVFFGLETLNSLGVGLYYTYLFWFLTTRFAFGDRENLAVAALNGLVYTVSAWQGGKLAQSLGYLRALALGNWIVIASLLAAVAVDVFNPLPHPQLVQTMIFILWTGGVSMTWPSLEAMVSDREPPERLPRMVGRYNVTWATGWAIAYFFGGALLEELGARSIFVVPLIIHVIQAAAIWWVKPRTTRALEKDLPGDCSHPQTAAEGFDPSRTRLFLRLAWIANPFAYLAITALIPVIPGLATQHGLSPTLAGIFCSVWFFARLAAFVVLWHWPAWHYRFRWLFGAKLALILSFMGILLAPSLVPIILCQVVFGVAVGVIYYSSLYYSMDAGEEKGAHGGIHEAAIGLGILAGPTIGYSALLLFPQHPQADTWAVTAALVLGLVALVKVRTGRSRT